MSGEHRLARVVHVVVASAVIALAVVAVPASPAHACSCEVQAHMDQFVDESAAVFVGRLIEKRGDDFDRDSTYVFDVELWVKGDLGERIEVQAPFDGAGCGFEPGADRRIGAAIWKIGETLHGNLCSQVDPDALLAFVAGPTWSSTGIGRILVGSGGMSPRLAVLDEQGHQVTTLTPPGPFAETRMVDLCPGGVIMVQATRTDVVVWDLSTLEIAATHDISDLEDDGRWLTDISCRQADASSILTIASDDVVAGLFETVPELTAVMALDARTGRIGTDYVVTQSDLGDDVVWIEIATGERSRITDEQSAPIVSFSVDPHPSESRTAVLKTRFDGEATLMLMGPGGTAIESWDLDIETYYPSWLDDRRVLMTGFSADDQERTSGLVLDTVSGEMIRILGWDASYTVADGDLLYGVSGSKIMKGDLSTGKVETLATLDSATAGPIVLIAEPQAAVPVTSTTVASDSTTPPLTAGPDTTDPPVAAKPDPTNPRPGLRWIVVGAIAALFALLIWQIRRPPHETP